MRRTLVGLGLIVSIGTPLLAQRAPDFSGTWVMQPTVRPGGNGMTAGGGAVAGGGGGTSSAGATASASASGRARTGGGGSAMSSGGAPPEIVVSQTAAGLTIERRAGENVQKHVYSFDGSENVNINGNVTARSRSKWEAGRLVTEGTQVVKTNQGEITGSFKEIRSIDAGGQLVVDITRQTAGRSVTSQQTFKKK